MFKLTTKEIEDMEKAVDTFEEDSKKCEVLSEGGTVVRDLVLNEKDVRICFIICYVDVDEEENGDELNVRPRH